MAEFFTPENLMTLLVLTALETVLGFDNLLYISIEAKRVPPDKQKYVRQVGIVLAIALRIALLFVVLKLISTFQDPLFGIELPPLVSGNFNGHSLIVLLGGVFLLYTALKEIYHMLAAPELGHGQGNGRAMRSVASALVWILIMNIVFSFDTVLSAVALTTVGALLDYGGLGDLLIAGRNNDFKAQVLATSVLCVLLAIALDLLLVGVQRVLTPWTRADSRTAATT